MLKFRSVLIWRFPCVLLAFARPLNFDGQTEFSQIFIFEILSYLWNLRKFDAREKYVFYSICLPSVFWFYRWQEGHLACKTSNATIPSNVLLGTSLAFSDLTLSDWRNGPVKPKPSMCIFVIIVRALRLVIEITDLQRCSVSVIS